MKFVCVLKAGGDFKPTHVKRFAAMIHKHGPKGSEVVCYTDSKELLGVGGYEWTDEDQPEPREYIHPKGEYRTVPLELKLPGWWSIIETMNERGPAIYMDLDTSIIGDLFAFTRTVERRLGADQLAMLRPWNAQERKRGRFASGVMGWSGDMGWAPNIIKYNSECTSIVPAESDEPGQFADIEKFGKLKYRDRVFDTDQHFISVMAREYMDLRIVAIQDLHQGFVMSYKRDLGSGEIKPQRSCCVVVFHGKPRPWDRKVKAPYRG